VRLAFIKRRIGFLVSGKTQSCDEPIVEICKRQRNHNKETLVSFTMAPQPPASILAELGLTTRSPVANGLRPSALDLLQELLESKVISEDALRSAHSSLSNKLQKQQATSKTKTDSKTTNILSVNTSNARTRHVALRLYYDGGNYSGLAENVGQPSDASIERALFQALQKAHLVESRETSGYSRCGRTDKGVSAAGQLVALKLKSAFRKDASLDADGNHLLPDEDLPGNALDKLQVWLPSRNKSADGSTGSGLARQQRELTEFPYDKILNNLLPPDIRIVGWSPVSDDFSARFSAATRTYRYFFCKRQLDLELMDQALQLLVGAHDFRNFCKMDVEKVYNFERTIYNAQMVAKDDNVCFIQIHGQAFLWHQIRCIAAVLFLVGERREPPTVVSDLLNVSQHPRKPSYQLADEGPLVLHDCGYKNLTIRYSVQNLWLLMCQQEKQWEDLILAAARIRNSIESLKENALVAGADLIAFVDRVESARSKRNTALCPRSLPCPFGESEMVAWRDGLEWIRKELQLYPGPNNEKEVAYTSLLKRCMGPTYEEKVASAKNSTRRKARYEENIVKKRKTKEEDSAFYKRMADQGSVTKDL
jgi:tRNA pseudouridine38/39 synthase